VLVIIVVVVVVEGRGLEIKNVVETKENSASGHLAKIRKRTKVDFPVKIEYLVEFQRREVFERP
jgi:hypothetical protein